MPSYLGVDWGGSCWVVVSTGSDPTVTTEPAFFNVWHNHGKRDDVDGILVDIPIGLLEGSTRACDVEARQRLKGRGASVFPVPSREVVEMDDYCLARKANGGSLGSQSWWLFPRIREVDVFLQEHTEAVRKVFESHPEICFLEFDESIASSKTSLEGRSERLEVLRDEDEELYGEIEEVVSEREDGAAWHDRISKGRLDDVIDAAVLALTAKSLDLTPGRDSAGYPAYPKNADRDVDPELEIQPEILHPPAG